MDPISYHKVLAMINKTSSSVTARGIPPAPPTSKSFQNVVQFFVENFVLYLSTLDLRAPVDLYPDLDLGPIPRTLTWGAPDFDLGPIPQTLTWGPPRSWPGGPRPWPDGPPGPWPRSWPQKAPRPWPGPWPWGLPRPWPEPWAGGPQTLTQTLTWGPPRPWPGGPPDLDLGGPTTLTWGPQDLDLGGGGPDLDTQSKNITFVVLRTQAKLYANQRMDGNNRSPGFISCPLPTRQHFIFIVIIQLCNYTKNCKRDCYMSHEYLIE